MVNVNNEREFDEFLKSRHVPDAPSNLAHRIIEAAQNQPAVVPLYVKVFVTLRKLLNIFSIPQPAFVLAAVVILSIGGVGLYSSDALVVEPTSEYYSEAEEVELAFYLDDIFATDY